MWWGPSANPLTYWRASAPCRRWCPASGWRCWTRARTASAWRPNTTLSPARPRCSWMAIPPGWCGGARHITICFSMRNCCKEDGRMIELNIPGRGNLRLSHLVLDVNGTLAKDGRLLDKVAKPLAALRDRLDIHLLTADIYDALSLLEYPTRLVATLRH